MLSPLHRREEVRRSPASGLGAIPLSPLKNSPCLVNVHLSIVMHVQCTCTVLSISSISLYIHKYYSCLYWCASVLKVMLQPLVHIHHGIPPLQPVPPLLHMRLLPHGDHTRLWMTTLTSSWNHHATAARSIALECTCPSQKILHVGVGLHISE